MLSFKEFQTVISGIYIENATGSVRNFAQCISKNVAKNNNMYEMSISVTLDSRPV